MDFMDFNIELDLNLSCLNKHIDNSDEDVEQEKGEREKGEREKGEQEKGEQEKVEQEKVEQEKVEQQEIEIESLLEVFEFSEEDYVFEGSSEDSLIIDDTQFRHDVLSGFDVNGLEACLVSNEIYQEYLFNTISQLENALKANKEKQEQLQRELYAMVNDYTWSKRSQRFLIGSKFFAAPYFRDEKDFFCSKNEDFKIKLDNRELENYIMKPISMKMKEHDDLRIAVKTIILKGLLNPLMERKQNVIFRWESEKASILKQFSDPEERRLHLESRVGPINSKIKSIDDEIVNISNFSDKKLFSDEIKKWEIDWYHISIQYMYNKYSDVSCRLMWKYFVNPWVNNDPWTNKEEDKLRELVEEYEGYNWDSIAEELETGRSALVCFIYFHSRLCKEHPWLESNDEKLLSLVHRHTINGTIDWSRVYRRFPHNNRHFIRNHYYQIVKDAFRRSFSEAENLIIFLCRQKYGKEIDKYLQHIPNRTTGQIQHKFFRGDEYRTMKLFSMDDDEKLVRLAKLHNCNLKAIKINYEFPGRYLRHLRSRLQFILTKIPDIFNKIDNPGYIFPKIPSSVGENCFKRRVYFCNYIRDTQEWFEKYGHESQRNFKGIKQLMKYFPEDYNENDDIEVPGISEASLDFMISEVSIICRNSLKKEKTKKQLKKEKTKKQLKQKPDRIDTEMEIDQLFYQYFDFLNFNLQKRATCDEFQVNQYNACRDTLHYELGLNGVASKPEDIEREDSYELFEINDKYPKIVVPPTLDVLELFQILVTDRARLGRMAMDISTSDIVHCIVGKTCAACQNQEQEGLDDSPSTSSVPNVKIERETCLCDILSQFRLAYNLLRRRFVSIFFWPGLLSSLQPPVDDIQERTALFKRKHQKPEISTAPPKKKKRYHPPRQIVLRRSSRLNK